MAPFAADVSSVIKTILDDARQPSSSARRGVYNFVRRPQSGWQIKLVEWFERPSRETYRLDGSLWLSYGCVDGVERSWLSPPRPGDRRRRGHRRIRDDRTMEREEQMGEERCAVFLTIDRVGSSILATLQPLYKYHRESPLASVALARARTRVYMRASLAAYPTRFIIFLPLFAPVRSFVRCFIHVFLFFRVSDRAFCHR